MFVRKELETATVRDSNLLKDAVQVAVANCLSKKTYKLWQKNPPWTPWGGAKPNG